MRENEVNGVDYYFMNRQTFLSKKMFEVSEFRNWYYGISEESLSKDKININFDIVANLDSVDEDFDLTKSNKISKLKFYLVKKRGISLFSLGDT